LMALKGIIPVACPYNIKIVMILQGFVTVGPWITI
jgi:hypothetical protein